MKSHTIVMEEAPAVGQFRQFGALGPVYEILEVNKAAGTVRILVPTTGEKTNYPIHQAQSDPRAE